jgi:uncharacterized circularly permuted ATP-grasp superfamily protein
MPGNVPLYSRLLMHPTQSSQFEHAALKNYLLDHAYDEMFTALGDLHPHCEPLLEHFASLPTEELQRRKQAADLSFLNQGITSMGAKKEQRRSFPTIWFPGSSPQPSGPRSNMD